MTRIEPTQSTKYRLLALSGNQCAFPECDLPLVNEEGHFIGQFCHIEGAEPGGERYNASQTDEGRRAIGNLILLCANHHIITNDVDKYDVGFLQQMKRNHERQFTDRPFKPSDITLAEVGVLVDESVRRAVARSNVAPYTDAEFTQDMAQIESDFKDQIRAAQSRFGNSSAVQQAGQALQKVATKKRVEAQRRKATSERMYELRWQDIMDKYEEKIAAKKSDIHARGLGFSGIGQQEVLTVERKRNRELEKLKLEFGKE
ncbi:MAG TPA: hypothetical protein VM581_02380 [Magnetospirillaceae bacterium]|nr:hypothetical protein [Magnetospirillaceae bacterium]